MPIVYRPARADDLERADGLVVQSINDLTERHGFGPRMAPRPPSFQLFSLADDPDGLWVAEEAGRILGFAFSWACGELWFLAQLFVSPDHQGRGIGNELLTRTMAHAKKTGAVNKALITFTFNGAAQGLYIRHGLFPRVPIYECNIARELLMKRLQAAQLRSVSLEDTSAHRQILAGIDARALGVSREKHHRFLINDGMTRGVLLYAGEDCVGYAYVSRGGYIGPLAVAKSDAAGPAFQTALNLAAESGSSQVTAFLPGPCAAAHSIAAEHGMRIVLPMVLMSAQDFGDWSLYLPRNPGFM